jgi:hypothetical protein
VPAKKCHRGHRCQRHDAEYRKWSGHARGVGQRTHGGRTSDEPDVAREANGADRTPASTTQTKDQVTS